jgi:dTDP-4-dehydrorhamnose 3,5-epimerase
VSDSAFALRPTALAGLTVVKRAVQEDERGSFGRIFCSDDLLEAGWTWPVAQINRSTNRREGTIRGLHFQKPPFSEAKLLYCVSGAIWDVAVDLRADSPTFLRWHSEMLTEDNHCGILIPPGFAHGYQTINFDVDLMYVLMYS